MVLVICRGQSALVLARGTAGRAGAAVNAQRATQSTYSQRAAGNGVPSTRYQPLDGSYSRRDPVKEEEVTEVVSRPQVATGFEPRYPVDGSHRSRAGRCDTIKGYRE